MQRQIECIPGRVPQSAEVAPAVVILAIPAGLDSSSSGHLVGAIANCRRSGESAPILCASLSPVRRLRL
jgi:hypothetical protein